MKRFTSDTELDLMKQNIAQLQKQVQDGYKRISQLLDEINELKRIIKDLSPPGRMVILEPDD